MKQTVVIKVTMKEKKCFFRIMESHKVRAKAMKIAVGVSGVESVSIKGKDKDELEVKGESIDTVKLTMLLRKNVGDASIVSVAEEKKDDKKDEKKDEVKIQHMVWPHGFGVHPYAGYEVPSHYQDQISCSIM